MYKVVVLCALFFLPGDANILHSANHSSDEPESTHRLSVPFQAAGSYEQALQVWKTAEDINGWIAANFSYDMARAMQLSETQRTSNEKVRFTLQLNSSQANLEFVSIYHALALRHSEELILKANLSI